MNKLKKIANLIKKTGDKIVVIDEQAEPQFVIMSIDSYEKILDKKKIVQDLTEDELLSNINRDIEILKNEEKNIVNNFTITDNNSDEKDIALDEINDLRKKAIELEEIAKATKNKNDDETIYFEPTEDDLLD